MTRVPLTLLFEPGELDNKVCPDCHQGYVATEPAQNDDGDWFQLGVCGCDTSDENRRCLLMPKAFQRWARRQ